MQDAQKLADSSSDDADILNTIAWSIVSDPTSDHRSLALAQHIARRAAESEPGGMGILDTLATAYYRTGNINRAVITEIRAIREAKSRKEKAYYESQVARFLAASLVKTGGPLRFGSGSDDIGIELALEPKGELGGEGRGVRLNVTGVAFPKSLFAYVLVMRDERIQGILSIATNSGIWNTRLVLPGNNAYFERWPDDTTFKVAMINTSADPSSGQGWTWDFQPMDPEIISLP